MYNGAQLKDEEPQHVYDCDFGDQVSEGWYAKLTGANENQFSGTMEGRDGFTESEIGPGIDGALHWLVESLAVVDSGKGRQEVIDTYLRLV